MAGTCEAGHRSTTDDYCDVCGLPVHPAPPPAAAPGPVHAAPPGAVRPSPPGPVRAAAPGPVRPGPPGPVRPGTPPPASQRCPHCRTPNPADALFCEACGYDYTTGTLPRTDLAGMLGLHPTTEEKPVSDLSGTEAPAPETDWLGDGPPAPTAQNGKPAEPTSAAADAAPADPTNQSAAPVDQPPAAPVDQPAPDQQAPAADPVPAPADAQPDDDTPTSGRPAPRAEAYVAEVWIDPDWYEVQQSPEPMPSVGLPTTYRLGTENLVGRLSRSRNIYPQVDCGVDSGCSRAQARIVTDGSRWYVEDLNSANGTYVAPSAGPLPTSPITGRTELGPDDRIYVGAWTRIVVRKASRDELDALGLTA